MKLWMCGSKLRTDERNINVNVDMRKATMSIATAVAKFNAICMLRFHDTYEFDTYLSRLISTPTMKVRSPGCNEIPSIPNMYSAMFKPSDPTLSNAPILHFLVNFLAEKIELLLSNIE